MVLIALLFVPCMIVAITIALPFLLFLAAVVAMVFVWYQSVVAGLLQQPAVATFPMATAPQPHVRLQSTLRSVAPPIGASFATTHDVSSLLIPEPPSRRYYSTAHGKLVTRSWSTSRLVHLNRPMVASGGTTAASLTTRSRSSASLLYRRDYDFERVAPQRRVRFG